MYEQDREGIVKLGNHRDVKLKKAKKIGKGKKMRKKNDWLLILYPSRFLGSIMESSSHGPLDIRVSIIDNWIHYISHRLLH